MNTNRTCYFKRDLEHLNGFKATVESWVDENCGIAILCINGNQVYIHVEEEDQDLEQLQKMATTSVELKAYKMGFSTLLI